MRFVRSTPALALLAATAAIASAQQPPAAAQPAQPTFKAEVKELPAVHAVVISMKGSYMQHPEAFTKLGGYLQGKGITPTGPAFGRYFSDPSVPEADLVWEIGFPVAASAKVEAPFEIKDLPAAQAAVHVHKGSMEELGPAWGNLVQWVMSNGYQPLSPAVQIFPGGMSDSVAVELRLPVKK